MQTGMRKGSTALMPFGITLLEVSVAAALLALLLGATGQFLRALSMQQRAAERRVVALQAIQAVAEQIGNVRFEELTTDAARQAAIPAALEPYLPGARLELDVADEAAPAVAKRVSIGLSWNAPGGQRAGQVHVTTWVFPDASLSEDGSDDTDE